MTTDKRSITHGAGRFDMNDTVGGRRIINVGPTDSTLLKGRTAGPADPTFDQAWGQGDERNTSGLSRGYDNNSQKR